MALFGKGRPRLPSYVDMSVAGLRSDPAWVEAIVGAGLDIDQCELVLRIGSAQVATGLGHGSPHFAQPVLLLGHGDTLAVAFPSEREVRVVKRPKSKAELQTQRSGTFQIMFAPVNQLDFWAFNDFKKGTPDGEQFGQTMLQFLRGQAAQPAVAPSPSSSAPPPSPRVATASTVSSPVNPEETAYQLLHRLAASCSEVMRLHGACAEEVEFVQRAHYVVSQPQAPESRASFLRTAERHEQKATGLLNDLRGAITTGRGLWSDFTFLSGTPDQGMDKLLTPFFTKGVIQGDELSHIMVGGIFLKVDFGSTIESFLETDSRLAELMKSMGSE